MNRRSLLTGIGAFLAAPAIVRASNIMPVKAWEDELLYRVYEFEGNENHLYDYGLVEIYDAHNDSWKTLPLAQPIEMRKCIVRFTVRNGKAVPVQNSMNVRWVA